MNDIEQAKAQVGTRAAAEVRSGMVVGLGTGSTTAYAIRALGRRIREEGLQITGVPTSYAAELLARAEGIPLRMPSEVEAIDVALDGADEVDPALNLIKGRGGAHTRERIVASMAYRFIVLVDYTKEVPRLGTRMPVPVEIMPFAMGPCIRRLEELGGTPVLRMGVKKDGPVVTDQGFWIVDTTFPPIEEPLELARAIGDIPGVLDHGLFIGMATDVLTATPEGDIHHRTRTR